MRQSTGGGGYEDGGRSMATVDCWWQWSTIDSDSDDYGRRRWQWMMMTMVGVETGRTTTTPSSKNCGNSHRGEVSGKCQNRGAVSGKTEERQAASEKTEERWAASGKTEERQVAKQRRGEWQNREEASGVRQNRGEASGEPQNRGEVSGEQQNRGEVSGKTEERQAAKQRRGKRQNRGEARPCQIASDVPWKLFLKTINQRREWQQASTSKRWKQHFALAADSDCVSDGVSILKKGFKNNNQPPVNSASKPAQATWQHHGTTALRLNGSSITGALALERVINVWRTKNVWERNNFSPATLPAIRHCQPDDNLHDAIMVELQQLCRTNSKMFRANKQQSTSWGRQPETAMAMAMAMAPRLIISLQIFVASLSLVDRGWWASSFSLCFCSILQQKIFVFGLTFLLHFLNRNNNNKFL